MNVPLAQFPTPTTRTTSSSSLSSSGVHLLNTWQKKTTKCYGELAQSPVQTDAPLLDATCCVCLYTLLHRVVGTQQLPTLLAQQWAGSTMLCQQCCELSRPFPRSLSYLGAQATMTTVVVKSLLKNEFASFQTLSRLFGPAQLHKCRRFLLGLNS